MLYNNYSSHYLIVALFSISLFGIAAPTAAPTAVVHAPTAVTVADPKPATLSDCNDEKSEPATILPILACQAAAVEEPSTPAAENPTAFSASGTNANSPPAATPTPTAAPVAIRVVRVSGVRRFHIDSIY